MLLKQFFETLKRGLPTVRALSLRENFSTPIMATVLLFAVLSAIVVSSDAAYRWGCPAESITRAGGLAEDAQPQVEWRHDLPSSEECCDAFVRCLDGENATRMYCPPGLSYSYVTGTCDLTERAVCNINCPSDADGFYPFPGHCGAYLHCSNGVLKAGVCGEGLYWDSARRRCSTKKCEFQCPVNSSGVVRPLPPPWGLSAYLVCDELSSSVRLCPAGLYFDPREGTCAYREVVEWLVRSGEKSNSGGEWETSSDSVLPRREARAVVQMHSIQVNGSKESTSSAAADTFGRWTNINVFPYPSKNKSILERDRHCPSSNGEFPAIGLYEEGTNDDADYVSCRNGIATLKTCPIGFFFNSRTGKCDDKQNKGTDNECPDPNGEFPILGNCGSYLSCIEGVAEIKECPKGLHFDAVIRICDVPELAQCEIKCHQRDGIQPLPGFCESYVQCIDGAPKIRSCAHGLKYNPFTETCDLESNVDCPQKCPKGFGTYPVLGFCDMFLICEHGKLPYVRRCSLGLHYNQLTGHCDAPKRARCPFECSKMNGVYPIEGDCKKFVKCTNGVPKIQSCARGLIFNADWGWCEASPVEDSGGCPSDCPEAEGVFPVKGRCDAARICRGGRVLDTIVCSEGLTYNATEETCEVMKDHGCLDESSKTIDASLQEKVTRNLLSYEFVPWNKED